MPASYPIEMTNRFFMKFPMTMKPSLSAFILLSLLSGCVGLPDMEDYVDDRRMEYKKSRAAGENLEVPPDLTREGIDNALVVPDVGTPSGSATYSNYARERKGGQARTTTSGGVLPRIEGVDLRRDGDKRWLVIQSPPQAVWPRLISFWQENGILLVEQNPQVGVMRTAWLENRADIKSDFLTDAIRSVFDGLYESDTRDQFRIRLEESRGGGTELYITHTGMQEKIVSGSAGQSEQATWIPRPTDHGLEAIMLRRMMIYFGVSEQRANAQIKASGDRRQQQTRIRSELIRNSNRSVLRIGEDGDRAWRLTGIALDRVGFAVEDRNQSQGYYLVRYLDPYADQADEGLLSKMAFWKSSKKINKDAQYQVRLQPQGGSTEVAVFTQSGQPDNSETAVRILTLLHEQIR